METTDPLRVLAMETLSRLAIVDTELSTNELVSVLVDFAEAVLRLAQQGTREQTDLPDIEVVAAAVHDAWMAQKRAKGFTSALSQQTGEEQMRPYAELSDAVKEYDRATVRTVYEAIRCANPRCESWGCAKHDVCECGEKSAPLVPGAYCRRCHKPTATLRSQEIP